jgi:hypothetical protein
MEQLLAQPAPVRLLVAVLAVGAGVVLWRVAPHLVRRAVEVSGDVRVEAASPSWWRSLVRPSYLIPMRIQAVAMIAVGAALVGTVFTGV